MAVFKHISHPCLELFDLCQLVFYLLDLTITSLLLLVLFQLNFKSIHLFLDPLQLSREDSLPAPLEFEPLDLVLLCDFFIRIDSFVSLNLTCVYVLLHG
jgi:hypothetical protein